MRLLEKVINRVLPSRYVVVYWHEDHRWVLEDWGTVPHREVLGFNVINMRLLRHRVTKKLKGD